MKVPVYSLDGKEQGSLQLPSQFTSEPVRHSLIRAVLRIFLLRQRQPYGAMPTAGMEVSAKLSRRRRNYKTSYGAGRSRVPRKTVWRRGRQFGWIGAEAPGTVGGRRAHPPKSSKILDLSLNKKERHKALRTLLASTVVEKKLHIIDTSFEHLTKAHDVSRVFDALSLSVGTRSVNPAGKALRGRAHTISLGPLLVVSSSCALVIAARNLPGVSVVSVKQLSPFHLGKSFPPRSSLWTQAALEVLERERLFMGGQR